ncbi:MAG: FtsX-like permease family protein [Armatimonadota bacterium]
MIGFVVKGLLRDRSRSLLPVLMVSAGVFLTVFLYGWMQGVINEFVLTSARFDTGFVKVTTRAYEEFADQMPNDLALMDAGRIIDEVKLEDHEMIWTPRIKFGGLLDIPDEKGQTRAQGPVMGMGVNLLESGSPDIEILKLKDALVKGDIPSKSGQILVSDELAGKLNLNIGDTATIITSTMYASMATYNFTVAGSVNFGITPMDRGTIIADIKDVQSALDMNGCTSEILGYTKDMVYDNKKMKKLAMQFNEKYSNKDDQFSPVMIPLRDQGGLAVYMDMGKKFGSIIVGIFVLAMSIVLWNAGLMNGLRRYGEIGVRLAIGESKSDIYRWMIAEAVVVGFIGSVIGTALGIAATYYLQVKGIDATAMMQKSTVFLANRIRAQVTPVSFIIGFLPGLIAPVIGAVFAGIGIYKRQTAQLFKELEV